MEPSRAGWARQSERAVEEGGIRAEAAAVRRSQPRDKQSRLSEVEQEAVGAPQGGGPQQGHTRPVGLW